ncbi:hypothetical protein [Celeribacter sp.]|uniref:hypothetical protein n=1 Tax=Celeribacter sp. TaxID=1890673 RepID=UPI003A93B94A
MRLIAALVAAVLGYVPMSVSAEPVVDAVQAHCITPLYLDTELGFGLERAPKQMEAKLLQGKVARLYRTDDPKILVVAHESDRTCEIMALGTDLAAFDTAISTWTVGEMPFTASDDSVLLTDAPSGGYYVAALPEGDFIQVFVAVRPGAKFIGVTVGRVGDSAMARQVLGIE